MSNRRRVKGCRSIVCTVVDATRHTFARGVRRCISIEMPLFCGSGSSLSGRGGRSGGSSVDRALLRLGFARFCPRATGAPPEAPLKQEPEPQRRGVRNGCHDERLGRRAVGETSRNRASWAWLLAAFATTATLAMGCTPDPATEIVIRIDSNMGPALQSVQVVLDRGANTTPIETNDYTIGPMFSIPGTIDVYTSNPSDSRPLRAQVTANTGDSTTTFTVTVSIAFVQGRTLLLEVFLDAACENAAVRNACTPQETCGAGGMCIPIMQPAQDYLPDAGPVDAPPIRDAVSDTNSDGGTDASDVTTMDARPDVGADVPVDSPVDGGAVDAPVDIPVIDAPSDLTPPRLKSPMSTSTVSLALPTLTWIPPASGGSSTFDIQLCTSRACTTVAHEYMQAGPSFTLPDTLTPGVWYWRVSSVCGTHACMTFSSTWEFTVLRPHTATATNDTSYGTALDLNGDGNADIAVGSPSHLDMGTGGTGTVWVYENTAMGVAATTELDGPSGTSQFGQAVSSAGDVNGDGFGDLIVCDPSAGKAFLYLGSASGVPTSFSQVLAAPTGAGGFCSSVAGLGDVNGDGYGDVVIGAPSTASNAGAAYVFLGRSGGLGTSASTIAAPAGGAFGTSVAGAGDLDVDGFADLIVGAPNAGTNGGMVYVYPGGASGMFTSGVVPVMGDQMSQGFGAAVAGGGDFDGDGRPDFVVGAPQSVAGAGRVLMFLGSGVLTSGSVWQVVAFPVSMNWAAGSSVSNSGDVDGDGLADVVLGGPNYSQASQTGSAFLVRSGSPTPWTRAELSAPTNMADTLAWGTAVLIADLNGDGYSEVAITDPRANSGNFGVNVYPNTAGTLGTGYQLMSSFTDLFGQSVAMAPWHSRWCLTGPGCRVQL